MNRADRVLGVFRAGAMAAACLLFLCAVGTSCGSREHGTGDAAKPKDYAALREYHASAIEDLAGRNDRDLILGQLFEAAKRESWGQSGDVDEAIMVRWPEDSLSLFLLDRRLESLNANSPDTAQEETARYLEDLRRRVPGSSLAAKALQKSLRISVSQDAGKFLARCTELINDSPDSIDARVALHERLEYYSQKGPVKDCAMDTLRFWAHFPDVVDRMGALGKFASNLKAAGWLLEAQMLSKAASPATVAKVFLDEFGHASESQGACCTLTNAYLDHAPEYLAAEKAVPELPPGLAEERLWWARLSSLSAAKLDGDDSIRYFTKYLATLEDRSSLSKDERAALAELHSAALTAVFNAFGQSRWMDRFATAGSTATVNVSDLLVRASRVGCDLEFERLDHPDDAGQYLKLIENHEQFLKKVHRIDGLTPSQDQSIAAAIAEAYDSVAARFPEAPEAAHAVLRKASVYREAGEQPKAIQAYDALISRYPKAPEVPLAKLDRAASLIAGKQYQDALLGLKAVLEEYAADKRIVPAAQFLAAVSEDNLGSAENAVRRMEAIADDFPKSTYAVRALFWLANHALAENEYEAARGHLAELIDRYPDDRLATDARQLKKRLDERFDPPAPADPKRN